MAAHARLKGFTLIEMLIAIAIFGLVVGIATFGYSLFSRQWEGWRGGYDRAQGQFQRVDLVATAMADTLPWVVRDERGDPGFYFLGRDEGLTLVTESPVFATGAPAVIRLFREPAREAGRWNLVYEEASLSGVRLRRAGQVLPFSHRMIVASVTARPEFSYYGWASPQERARSVEVATDVRPRWYTAYDGLERRQHPLRIAIALGRGRAEFFVPERADVSLERYTGPE